LLCKISSTMNTDNPCLACNINQDCCTNLVGLRLTKAEYDLCFVDHVETGKVEVAREGPIYIINPDEKQKCPNWKGEGCSVYEDRPLECRLFPHTLYVKEQTPEKVEVRFHAVHSCPLVGELRMKEDMAEEMVNDFCNQAFESNAHVIVKPESKSEERKRKIGMLREKFTRRFRKLVGK